MCVSFWIISIYSIVTYLMFFSRELIVHLLSVCESGIISTGKISGLEVKALNTGMGKW